jgi:hypothetical protein
MLNYHYHKLITVVHSYHDTPTPYLSYFDLQRGQFIQLMRLRSVHLINSVVKISSASLQNFGIIIR